MQVFIGMLVSTAGMGFTMGMGSTIFVLYLYYLYLYGYGVYVKVMGQLVLKSTMGQKATL